MTRARSPSVGLRRATRQGLMAIAGILLLVGAITTQQRLGRLDLFAMLPVGIVSSAGPAMLALIFLPPERPPTADRAATDHPPAGGTEKPLDKPRFPTVDQSLVNARHRCRCVLASARRSRCHSPKRGMR